MARTTSALVQGVLVKDYDGETSLTPYIDTASAMVSRVVACATRKGVTISTEELELIERWLSAHLYAQSDKPYASKSTGGVSASFQGQTSMGLDSTLYGQTAMRIDPSGCLLNIDKRQVAGGFWAGKRPSEQLPFDQRS